MKTKNKLLHYGLLLLVATSVSANAQDLSSDDLARRTVERRAVEAVIWGMPAVNTDLMLQEMLNKTDAKVGQVVHWGRPLDWHNQTLTPNPDTLYFMAFFNTKDAGPIVIDVLPANGGALNINIVDVWQTPLEDAGVTGADQGKGGKYLILPPGYAGKVPEGYIPVRSDTFGGYALIRSNLKSHGDADVARSLTYGKTIKVYALSQADNPPATVFVDAKDVLFDSTIHYDASFFDNLNRIIQSEPWLARDRAMIDQLKSIGIEKGKTYSPDAQTRNLLAAAAREAQAWLEAKYDAGLPPFFSESSRWTLPVLPGITPAWATSYGDPDAYPVDARGVLYTYGFVAVKRLGAGQFYLISLRDKDGNDFDGGKTYRVTVPPNVPVEQYWSVTAYDRQTHTLIKNMVRASRSSQIPELQKNADGSVHVYFGPAAPAGKESNWCRQIPRGSSS